MVTRTYRYPFNGGEERIVQFECSVLKVINEITNETTFERYAYNDNDDKALNSLFKHQRGSNEVLSKLFNFKIADYTPNCYEIISDNKVKTLYYYTVM